MGWSKWLALLCAALFLCIMGGVAMAEETMCEAFVYGQSERGRDLACYRVGPSDSERSILLLFGVHGFEDAFDRDGEVLERIAYQLIDHYTAHPEELGIFRLYIIPSANPDGLLDGTTQEGFGRSNANEIDINRDFSSDWSRNFKTRNRTGQTPFSTAEARAIRDLVLELEPTYAMDVHGWAKGSYGNGKMAVLMAEAFGFEVNRLPGGGMACAWLNTVTKESMLLELPPDPDLDGYVLENSNRMIQGLNAWMTFSAATYRFDQ